MSRQNIERNIKPHTYDAGETPQYLPELSQIIGVTNKSLNAWLKGCEQALNRIENAGNSILKRDFRERVVELRKVIKEIISNCWHDPDDIREEMGLPTILERLASTVEEYLTIVSRRNRESAVLERLSVSEEIVNQACVFLSDLLREMKSNDAKDALSRAQVLGRIFEVKPSKLDLRNSYEGDGLNKDS